MDSALTVQFQSPAAETAEELILEQIPWDNYIGKVTTGAMMNYLKALMYGYEEDGSSVDCGLDANNAYSCVVMAYPDDPNMAYIMRVTHGDVGSCVVKNVDFTELVNIKLASEAKLKYPAQSIVSVNFIGSTYDDQGRIVPHPAVTFSGRTITLDASVYGIMLIVYEIITHGYTVTVPRREIAEENYYSSIVFANWAGGKIHLELEPPPSAEDLAAKQLDCWSVFSPFERAPGKECPPQTRIADRDTTVEYCSQETIDDEIKNERDDPNYIC